METTFDSRIIKVEHRIRYSREFPTRLDNVQSRTTTLDRSSWKHPPISRHTSSNRCFLPSFPNDSYF